MDAAIVRLITDIKPLDDHELLVHLPLILQLDARPDDLAPRALWDNVAKRTPFEPSAVPGVSGDMGIQFVLRPHYIALAEAAYDVISFRASQTQISRSYTSCFF